MHGDDKVMLLPGTEFRDTSPQDVTAVATEDGGGTASAFITSTITGVGLTEVQVTMTSTNPGKVGEQLVYTVTGVQHPG